MERNVSYAVEAPSRDVDVKRASSVWKLFHKKDTPRELISVEIPWPEAWEFAGEAVTTYYNSDKWYKTGEYTRYYHDHTGGGQIKIWHPAGLLPWTKTSPKPPRGKYPTAVAVLGFSLGVDVKRHDTDKIEHLYPEKGSYLVASPDRKRLWIVEPSGGIVAMIVGPGMTVEERGIVG
jgi:hypothetical protein